MKSCREHILKRGPKAGTSFNRATQRSSRARLRQGAPIDIITGMSGRGGRYWGLYQQDRRPTFRAPRMSEVRLSPTIMASAASKSGIAAKQAWKKAGLGL